jgi:hypothetical protein
LDAAQGALASWPLYQLANTASFGVNFGGLVDKWIGGKLANGCRWINGARPDVVTDHNNDLYFGVATLIYDSILS